MAASDPLQIGSDLLLVHEGDADRHIIGELTRRVEIRGFQPLSMKGQGKMRPFLKALSASPHFKSPVPGFEHPVRALAIVLDAEEDATATFQRVRAALAAANLPTPNEAGGIVEGTLRVGVFLAPDNRSPGKIETLCLHSVENDPAWPCLEVFFNCVRERGGKIPANIDKARAQAFLATRPQPDLPVGLAALEGYWDFTNRAFEPLVTFLRQMAGAHQR